MARRGAKPSEPVSASSQPQERPSQRDSERPPGAKRIRPTMDDWRMARELEWLDEHMDQLYHVIDKKWYVWDPMGQNQKSASGVREAIKLARELEAKTDG